MNSGEKSDASVPKASPAVLEGGAAARDRLKSGRNDPCPCGSGRKYKKCCLRGDEELVQQMTAARKTEAVGHADPAVPPVDTAIDGDPGGGYGSGLAPEVRSRLDGRR